MTEDNGQPDNDLSLQRVIIEKIGDFKVHDNVSLVLESPEGKGDPGKSEERYRMLLETMHEGIWMIDADSRTTFANKAMADMLGYTFEEMNGKLLFDFMDNDSVILAKRNLSRQRTKIAEGHEFEFMRKDGSRIYASLTANPIKGRDGEYLGAIAGVQDITQRKIMEDSLRQSEEKMSSIYRASPIGIGIVVGRVITEVNPLICGMTGYSKKDLIDKDSRILYPSMEEYEYVGKEKYRQLRESGKGTVETKWKKKEGSFIDILLSFSLLEPKDASKGVTFTALDITDQKRSREKMIASETRYRRLFESAKDGILILDASSGKIVDANPFMTRMLGYSHDEFTGKHVWEIGAFRDVFENEEKFMELKKKEYVRYSHLPLEAIDGRKIDVEFVSNVYDVNGSRVIQCNIRDITRRKKMEDKLESTLSELTAINQNAPIVMMLVDRDRKVRKVNGTAAKFSSRDPDDMIGLPGGEALRCLNSLDDPRGCGFGPECSDCMIRNAVLDTFKDRKNRSNIETWLPFPHGNGKKEICLDVSTSFLTVNDEELILLCANDITDRKMATIALRESEQKYRSLIETTSEGYLLLDNDGKTVEVNDALCSMLGYDEEDIIGKSPMEFMDDDNKEIFREMFTGRFRTRNRTYEMQMMSSRGEIHDLFINATTLKDRQDRSIGTFAMMTDVSKFKRINSELEAEKRRSNTFLDLLSHDIGNIHQGILLSVSLFNQEHANENIKKRSLASIQNLANRSIHLVKNVILLTRLDSIDMEQEEIDVLEIIDGSIDSCRSVFPDRSIKHHTICKHEHVMIEAEPIVSEVFFNLYHNSIKVQDTGEPRIETEVIKDESSVKVQVRDWGPGIPDNMKEKLLFRTSNPGEKVHSGIGLSLVRELMNRYNGSVRIMDRSGGSHINGTIFELTFPLTDEK